MACVVECLEGRHPIACEEDLCFFQQDDTAVHLIVKPERRCYIEPLRVNLFRESKKKVRITCSKCEAYVGVELSYGPEGSHFLAFGKEKILFYGKEISSKEKWRSIYMKYPKLNLRTSKTFRQSFGQSSGVDEVDAALKKEEYEPPPIAWPETAAEFDFQNLVIGKKPRRYQLEVYLEALQRDLVAVMPTGSGKTLIAALVLAKMRALNPFRLGLFVVDRIPLVFQQASAITADTGLKVCALCGENKTRGRIRGLTDGTYEVVVITAGALVELLRTEKLTMNYFSCMVLDEVHHTRSHHSYTRVIQYWVQSAVPDSRPRLLGLTASPFPVSTYEIAIRNLKQFRSLLQDAVIFKPDIPQSSQQIKWYLVNVSEDQERFFAEIVQLLQRVSGIINEEIRWELSFTLDNVKNFASQLRGDIRAIGVQFGKYRKLCLVLLALLASLETADRISIAEAVESLQNGLENILNQVPNFIQETVSEISEKYANYQRPSARLKALDNLLEQRNPLDSRVVVFVDTRTTARLLLKKLNETKPEWNAERVVGHGGFDGMTWTNDQEIRMEDFRDGKSRLLIATSVLEEGIDVAACNLVVRFSPVESLISYVQSRGRARMAYSDLVMIVTEEQHSRVMKVVQSERVLNMALVNHANEAQLPSANTHKLMDLLTESVDLETEWTFQFNKSNICEDEISMEIYFEAFQCSETDMKLAVIDSIETSCGVKVKRVDLKRNTAAIRCGAPNIFPSSDTTVLLSIKPHDSACSFDAIWSRLFLFWDFKVNDSKNFLPVFARFPLLSKYAKVEPKTSLETEFSCGKFMNRNHFKDANYMNKGELKFGKQIISLECEGFTLDILRETIGSYIYVSFNTMSKKFLFFIPLSSFPNWGGDDDAGKYVRHSGFDDLMMGYLNDYPILKLEIRFDAFETIMQFFATLEESTLSIFLCRMTVIEEQPLAHDMLSHSFNPLDPEIDEDQFKSRWSLAVLKSTMNMFLPDSILESVCINIEKAIEQKDKQRLKRISYILDQLTYEAKFFPYWSSIEARFNKFKDTCEDIESSESNIIYDSAIQQQMMLKRLVVTPGRLIFETETLFPHSRITRHFKDQVDFLTVSFKDEQRQRISHVEIVNKHFRNILLNGLEICGRRYRFLCSSASQLRAHHAYFVYFKTDNLTIEDLRQKIINNPEDFRSAAKYLSRLGLFCSGDRETVSVLPNERQMIDDAYAESGDMVTDGAGKVTAECAAEIAANLKVDSVPSVFQIRYSGIKGVILKVDPAVDEDFLRLNDPQLKLLYRPSMQKFLNTSNDLNVVNYSRKLELHLNREIIMLLLALHSFDETSEFVNTLLKMHTDCIKTLGKCFSKVHIAVDLLIGFFPKEYVYNIMDCGFDILVEPFWFSVISGAYAQYLKGLSSKTRIPVDKGCLLIGVPDPLGVLKDGEIFFNIKKNEKMSDSYAAVTGRVVIYRNPCLHPGDARIVTAVDIPELHYFRDCLILPAKDVSVSLASECSGGDLDGDLYGCIYDERLVPKCESYPALNYGELAKGASEQDDPTSNDNIVDFFCNVMENDALGRIAYMHLTLCSLVKEGALHPLAVKLAESQSIAVDYPKTGIIPQVPKEALKMTDSVYPDFLEKPNSFQTSSSQFIADNPIGIMFRECRSFNFEQSLRTTEFKMDERMNLKDSYLYMRKARMVYKAYVGELKIALLACDLDTETDLMLGRPLNWNESQLGNKMKAMDSISACRQSLKDRYRNIFLNDSLLADSNQILAKASAWYRVICEQRKKKEVFYTFVWLVIPDEICLLKRYSLYRNSDSDVAPNTMESAVGFSVRKYFNSRLCSILDTHCTKQAVFSALSDAVGQTDLVRLHMFGSSSIFVCEEYSDVDLYAEVKPLVYQLSSYVSNEDEFKDMPQRTKDVHFLQMLVSPHIDRVATSKHEVFDAEVPIVRCSMSFNDETNETSVDISMNPDGWRKTRYIQRFYAIDKIVFPCFLYLMRWARFCGLSKGISSEVTYPFATAEFYALILYMFEKILDKKPTDDVIPLDSFEMLAKQVNELNSEDLKNLGNLLIKFFEIGSSMESEIVYTWPVLNRPSHVITTDMIYKFSTHCSRSLTILTACRCAEATLDQCNLQQTQILLPLSRMLTANIGRSKNFHQEVLAFKSGAKVELFTKNDNSFLIMVKAEGSIASIIRLREELVRLSRTSNALSRSPRRTPRSFVAGSCVVLIRNFPVEKTRIGFKDSFGPFNVNHTFMERSKLVPIGKDLITLSNEAWIAIATNHLTSRLITQMELFCEDEANLSMVDSLETTLRYGTFYSVNITPRLPDYNKTLEIVEFSNAMERNSVKGCFSENGFEFEDKDSLPVEMRDLAKTTPKRRTDREPTKAIFRDAKGIASSFCPGLLASNCADIEILTTCKKLYEEVLVKCGFSAEPSRKCGWWRVSLMPNIKCDISIVANDDDEKKVSKIEHRPISWLSVTICDSEDTSTEEDTNSHITANHDMRMKLYTIEKILPGSDLHKFCFNNGEEKFPLEFDSAGEPKINHLPLNIQKAITHIRYVKESLRYNLPDDEIDAEIIIGKEYSGHQMSLVRHFVEMNFFFNSSPIKEALRNNSVSSINQYFMNGILRKALLISDVINEHVKDFNS